MNPFIVHLKDKITLGPCNDDQIRKGAVVLARDSRGRFVIHRIIKREGDIITLRGDGNYLRTIEKARVSDVIALMYSVTKKRRTYSVESLWSTQTQFLAKTCSKGYEFCIILEDLWWDVVQQPGDPGEYWV